MAEEFTFMGRVRVKIDSLAQTTPEKLRMLEVASYVIDQLSADIELQHKVLDAVIRQERET